LPPKKRLFNVLSLTDDLIMVDEALHTQRLEQQISSNKFFLIYIYIEK